MKKQFKLLDLDCASCAAKMEQAIRKLDGVHGATVSFLAQKLTLDADDAVLLQGVVDCFFEEDGELVVVDFKTDRIGRTQIEERAEHYRPQLEAYSMALMRVMGKKVREKVLYFFSVGEEKVL